MQSNVNFLNSPTGLDLSQEEMMVLRDEYETDGLSICPECEIELSEDELHYVVDTEATYEQPEEAHNACPNCNAEVEPFDLVKPDFFTWLKLTA